MSKRCKLQKEYYKEFGNYKGKGKYTDHYVKWLESKVLAIDYKHCCESDSELLCDCKEQTTTLRVGFNGKSFCEKCGRNKA